MKAAWWLASVLVLAASPLSAAEKPMNAKQMSALLSGGKTIKVTGAGDHYSGKVALTTDGRGTGEVTTGNGATTTIEGVWRLKANQFCHQWEDVETTEVCEAWVLIEPKKALILIKRTEVGIVTWE